MTGKEKPGSRWQRNGDHQANFWRDAENHPPVNGETIQAFHQRIGDAWELWQQAMKGQRVLLVCHGGVIRMVLSHVLGMSRGRPWQSFRCRSPARSQVRIDDTQHGTLRCLVRHGR